MLALPSVTSIASVRCGSSASASSTPSLRRSSRDAASRRSSASAARLCSSAAISSSKPSIEADFLGVDVGDFLEAGEAFGDQQLGERLVDVELGLEHLRALDELALALLGGVGLGQDVDLRVGQLAGEADVLAAAADGQAQLVIGDDHFDAAFLLVDDDAADGRRLEAVDDEGGEVLGPRDDVDLLALQLLDDRLDAAALHADAGADRVDRAVVADDADLGAAARDRGRRP